MSKKRCTCGASKWQRDHDEWNPNTNLYYRIDKCYICQDKRFYRIEKSQARNPRRVEY